MSAKCQPILGEIMADFGLFFHAFSDEAIKFYFAHTL
jgi:hypothetical protein